MKLKWEFHSITFKKHTFKLIMNFYHSNLRGWLVITYDRDKHVWKHALQARGNKTNIFGDRLVNIVMDSFNQDQIAKECILDLETFNGTLQKDLEQGRFKIYESIFNSYIIELKYLDFKLDAQLDRKHKIEKLTLAYRYGEYDMAPLLDRTSYMKISEKIHQKLRIKELFNK